MNLTWLSLYVCDNAVICIHTCLCRRHNPTVVWVSFGFLAGCLSIEGACASWNASRSKQRLLFGKSMYKQTRLTALNHSQIVNRDDLAPKWSFVAKREFCYITIILQCTAWIRFVRTDLKDMNIPEHSWRFAKIHTVSILFCHNLRSNKCQLHYHNTPSSVTQWWGIIANIESPASMPHAKLSLFCLLKGPRTSWIGWRCWYKRCAKKILYIYTYNIFVYTYIYYIYYNLDIQYSILFLYIL